MENKIQENENQIERLLTVKELAQNLRISRVYAYKMAREGKIPFYHIGKAIRFSPSSIQAWLQERKR